MSDNYFETELRKDLAGKILAGEVNEAGCSDRFFIELMQRYPIMGSKINWSLVPNSSEAVIDLSFGTENDQFISFFDCIASRHSLSGVVTYVGDSQINFAISAPLDCLRSIFPRLLEVPQHHYIIGPEFLWCMCFTMEGGMGFGFSPVVSNKTV